ncbi:MAG: DUF512 domain-containing protein [Firmicutes bacterium]|nr:DUF512 domain-containing protein [Bacillota bacterium]
MSYPRIAKVVPGSIADQVGVQAGFSLVAINGQTIEDILDYRVAIANDSLTLSLIDTGGQLWEIDIEKEYGEDLGLVFDHPTLAPLHRCQNNCLFCFVAQLPPRVRPTLRVKDDDYRLSSLHGSFVTLTNLSEADWQRLLDVRPSPLYISVHTTNGRLREKLMRNPKAGKIMEQLRKLADHHIEMHCQIVLVPGFNDGMELERTMNDLLSLWPAVQSVAIVPVGLTRHRIHLPPLCKADAADARAVIDSLLPLARRLRRKLGVSFAYLADEFFVLANSDVPERRYYDDFPQKENGIGLLRLLLDELAPHLKRLPRRLSERTRVFWVTGTSAAPTLQRIAQRLNQIEGLWVDVVPVANRFFGETVTVAGLLCGQDILATLEGMDIDGAKVLIPAVALRTEEQDFLDDMTFAELQGALPQARLIATPVEGQALIDYTLGKEA